MATEAAAAAAAASEVATPSSGLTIDSNGAGFDEFGNLLTALMQPRALVQLLVLGGCLVLAWTLVRWLRGPAGIRRSGGSIWFGRRIVDGVLFPVLALALAAVAKLVLGGFTGHAVFRLAIPVLLSLTVIRLTVRVLGASFPASRWVIIAERSVSWIAWIGVVAWITGVLPMVLDAMEQISWHAGAMRMTLRAAVEGALMAALVLMIALWVASAVEKRLLRGTGNDLSIRKMAANIVRAVLLSIGVLVALSTVGLDLTAFSVLGGAIGVGLGFGLQKIAANYVSGFVILAERSLRIGDMVKVDGFEGRITDIRTRYTVVRSLSGRESVVPNEMLITQRVENASLADPKLMLSSAVQVAYGTDVQALQPRLAAAVGRVARVIDDPAPTVALTAFGADGMDLLVNFWIRDPENGQVGVRSDVNLAILALFKADGIEIPFPQRVLHHAGGSLAKGRAAPARDLFGG